MSKLLIHLCLQYAIIQNLGDVILKKNHVNMHVAALHIEFEHCIILCKVVYYVVYVIVSILYLSL